MVIEGFTTTADFLYAVLSYPLYADGDASEVDIKFLESIKSLKGWIYNANRFGVI